MINIQSALETIKHGDIKSAMDQLQFVNTELYSLQEQISNVYAELQKKVNLVSEYKEGLITVTKLGPGTVEVDGDFIYGVGTFFTTDCEVGNLIKIGDETIAIDSIISDTELRTIYSFNFTSNYGVLYAIIKNATQELLTGDFQYGELNAKPYNGVVTQGSTLQQYGRMSLPTDVVNVQFVQRAVNPAMARAMNAIQRTGDYVTGTATAALSYTFDYVSMNWLNSNIAFDSCDVLFNSNTVTVGSETSGSDLKYYGESGDPNNVLVRKDLTDYVGTINTDNVYARWEATGYPGQAQLFSPFKSAGSSTKQESLGFSKYFKHTVSGLECLIDCKILITASMTTTVGVNIYGSHNWNITCIIKNTNGVIYAREDSGGNSATGNIAVFCHGSPSAVIQCVKGEILLAGFIQNHANNADVRVFVTLTGLR